MQPKSNGNPSLRICVKITPPSSPCGTNHFPIVPRCHIFPLHCSYLSEWAHIYPPTLPLPPSTLMLPLSSLVISPHSSNSRPEANHVTAHRPHHKGSRKWAYYTKSALLRTFRSIRRDLLALQTLLTTSLTLCCLHINQQLSSVSFLHTVKLKAQMAGCHVSAQLAKHRQNTSHL